MAYHYLAASLPTLTIDSEPPFSSEELLRMAGGLMRPEDYEDLSHVVHRRSEQAEHPALRHWVRHETQLRNCLVRIRASRLDIDPALYLHTHEEFDTWTEEAGQAAMALDDPLERERMLDEHRWGVLDEMEQEDPFGAGRIFAFARKLRIVERWATLDKDKGREKLDTYVRHHLEGGLQQSLESMFAENKTE